ncbi:NAD(P)/FAD-dependent oxidoreductase [Alkalicaulis satelles]|uniref:NAD(P)/FAD-dependent oxidoreductase n=1 Tax=Alkalicaulis satelles TaxID=2609175 RepID=A0A5M6ZJB4_9PROT|nr:NAD(P)/FAD-dependent oxidoreductase [Alkalicaulis satelles]KAA5803338.1 NAD(P)/FAD-dependent oxidoreductase [Alkalicaulis satelles]
MPAPRTDALPGTCGVLIIGAGFAGLAMGRALDRAGVRDFLILDRADGPGGVWRANRYPGAACDVPSHLYSFSYYPNPDWSRKFSPQAEILAYLERAADAFGLGGRMRFNEAVAALSFDEAGGRWQVTLQDGRTLTARTVVSAVGQLSEPFTPAIQGMQGFDGAAVHAAQWPDDLDVTGKDVAVIGNAASAVQLLPELADKARRLTVFQRTPNWIIAKPDRAFTASERFAFRYIPGWLALYRAGSFWIHESRYSAFVSGTISNAFVRWNMLRKLKREVRDPDLRARLTPDYAPGCKRILLTNDVFATLQRDHVTLDDSGVARAGARELINGRGQRVPADVVVFATGFQTTDFLPTLTVTGRGGADLRQAWGASPSAYRGVAVHGFPNLFILYGPNTNLGHNSIVYMLERQCAYAARQIARLFKEDLRTLEVTAEAQDAYNEQLQAKLARTVWAEDCPSWYKTRDGVITNNWAGLASGFARTLARRDDQAWSAAR